MLTGSHVILGLHSDRRVVVAIIQGNAHGDQRLAETDSFPFDKQSSIWTSASMHHFPGGGGPTAAPV